MHPSGQTLQHNSQSQSHPFAVGARAYSGGLDVSGGNISSDYPSPGSAKSGSSSNSKSQLDEAYEDVYATRHTLILKLVKKKKEEKEKERLAILATEEKANLEQIETGQSKAKEDVDKEWGWRQIRIVGIHQ